MHKVSNKSPIELDFIWIKSIVCGFFWLPTQEFYGLQKNDIKRIWKYCTLLETSWIQNEQHNLGMLLCNHFPWIPLFKKLRNSIFSWWMNRRSALEITLPVKLLQHCWKKKRDFLIIRSKVGGFFSLTVDGNEYFVGWKENLLHKYHQKWLPIRLMFHHIDPIIRSKIGGFLILSVANCEYFVC